MGGPEDIIQLREQRREINDSTIRRAKSRIPKTEEEHELAAKAWDKFQADVSKGYASEPMSLDRVNLGEVLLVDSFPVHEKRANSVPKVRVITNYKTNHVNHYAWIPSKLRYDGFNELQQAASILKSSWPGQLEMGKADFKSAYKTVPPATDQAWLCWALVYNPHLGEHQVTQLHSQTFGSLGAVIAWYRAAKAIQTVMEQLGLVVQLHVDDCFWITP